MTNLLLYDHQASICSQMARLALVEKGLQFERRQVDIMEVNEQFEPWYVALNPRAVVPTLQIDEEIVTDTIHIVNRLQAMRGADLSGDATTQDWLRDIMAPQLRAESAWRVVWSSINLGRKVRSPNACW